MIGPSVCKQRTPGNVLCNNYQELLYSIAPGAGGTLTPSTLPYCVLGMTGAATVNGQGTQGPGIQYFIVCDEGEACFPVLSATAPTPGLPGVTLAGNWTAEDSGTVLGVETMLMTCPSTVTPTACPTTPVIPYTDASSNTEFPPLIGQELQTWAGTNLKVPLTQYMALNMAYGIPLTNTSFGTQGSCGGAGQPPCQVPVLQGQTVSVSVGISFQ